MAFNLAHRQALVDEVKACLKSPPPLVEYGQYLKELYAKQDDSPGTCVQWFPAPTAKCLELAMTLEMITNDEIRDEHEVNGKYKELTHDKKQVKLENIFKFDDEKRQVILMEGVPGSGKSTQCWVFCKKWGEGEIFQEKFDLVILVQLRDPRVQAASTLADILPARDRAEAESVARQIEADHREKVLFILDGWDELPVKLRDNSYFKDLVSQQPLDGGLYNSAVVVTSRPIASGDLQILATSRVEIVGFTPEVLQQYFKERLSCDPQRAESLLRGLSASRSNCYLPLTAAIIADIYSGKKSLPPKIEEIFASVVLNYLPRYRRKSQRQVAKLESLDTLPGDLKKCFTRLCNLAYEGVETNSVTFSSTKVEGLIIDNVGLLQAVPSLLSHEQSVHCSFIHLQIQEFLAAYHISSLPVREQIACFIKIFRQARFPAVFQFYSGIIELPAAVEKPSFFSKTTSIVRKKPTGVGYNIIKIIQGSRDQPQLVTQQLLVSLFHCLYEADDPSLCKFVASQLHRRMTPEMHEKNASHLNLVRVRREEGPGHEGLSPLDCLSLGYFLWCVPHYTDGPFKVDLRWCALDDQACEFLTRGLFSHTLTASTATCQLWVDVGGNHIHTKGAQYLAEILRSANILHTLKLGLSNYGAKDNKIEEAGFKSIVDALHTNTSLVELYLGVCSIEITEMSGPVLGEMLQRNKTLKVLALCGNNLGDGGAGYVADGLKVSTSLTELNLERCSITDKGVSALSEALLENTSLQKLFLLDNNKISQQGVTQLMHVHEEKHKLVQLKFPEKFNSQSIGTEPQEDHQRGREYQQNVCIVL